MNFPLIFAYQIDSAVPLPAPKHGDGRRKYPFPLMMVGDSFFVAGATRSRLASSIRCAQQNTGRRFAARVVTEQGAVGVRVWRTA